MGLLRRERVKALMCGIQIDGQLIFVLGVDGCAGNATSINIHSNKGEIP